MPAVRPAPASQLPGFAPTAHQQLPQPQSNQQPSTIGSQPAQQPQPVRGRKRAKQAATAGTALLALFSFAVFMGPLGSLQGLSQTAPQELPLGLHNSPADVMRGGGRVLMSALADPADEQLMSASTLNATHLQFASEPNTTQLQYRQKHLSGLYLQEGSGENDVPVEGGTRQQSRYQLQNWSPEVSAGAGLQGLQSIVLKPSDKAAEQDALQQLKASLLAARLLCCCALSAQ